MHLELETYIKDDISQSREKHFSAISEDSGNDSLLMYWPFMIALDNNISFSIYSNYSGEVSNNHKASTPLIIRKTFWHESSGRPVFILPVGCGGDFLSPTGL